MRARRTIKVSVLGQGQGLSNLGLGNTDVSVINRKGVVESSEAVPPLAVPKRLRSAWTLGLLGKATHRRAQARFATTFADVNG